MITMNKQFKTTTLLALGMLFSMTSCNDFLDREPLDKITPEAFFNTENDLAAYSIKQYNFSSYSGFNLSILKDDDNTDNQAASGGSTGWWVPGEKRTPVNGGVWDFTNIRKANYFFEKVLPKYEMGILTGDATMINHYIGEMYFIRAYNYFSKLVSLGDFPIITDPLPDEKGVLMEASKRQPRNKVARFILEDLDRAINMMSETTANGKNRLTKSVALQFKSRVALFEATWLKYHKGTNRVPGGPDWPGGAMEYNSGFTIDIDKEVDFFLTEAMESAEQVADKVKLTDNSGVYNPLNEKPYGWNPYFEMFSAVDMEPIDEILFWRAYDKDLGVAHAISTYLAKGGGNMGYTRSMVEAFLMKNGMPIYAQGSGYAGDVTIENVKKDRDDRLQLFVAAPSDYLKLSPTKLFEAPVILEAEATRCPTGYAVRKFLSYDPAQIGSGSGTINTYGCILFRGVESYLNYMEACYEKNGRLDAKAVDYWKTIRRRAGVSEDIDATIAATDLSKEDDWGKYSAGQLIDPVLFNIRRERRVELMSESTRMRDLKRWRALDQVRNYQVEGFNLWGGELEKLYVDSKGNTLLIPTGTSNKQPNVSDKNESGNYLRPYQIVKNNNLLYNGYTWSEVNYLEPIAALHFVTTSSNPDDVETSTIYQNPGWSKIGNESALK